MRRSDIPVSLEELIALEEMEAEGPDDGGTCAADESKARCETVAAIRELIESTSEPSEG